MFLGDGVLPDPSKVKALQAFTLERIKAPRDVKVFLATAGYMRRFVPGFAKLAQPLAKYLKVGAELHPGLTDDPEAQAAFLDLRGRLAQAGPSCVLVPLPSRGLGSNDSNFRRHLVFDSESFNLTHRASDGSGTVFHIRRSGCVESDTRGRPPD